MKSKNLGGINKLALFAGSITVFSVASLVNIGLKTPSSEVLSAVSTVATSCEQQCKAENPISGFDISDGYDYRDCVGVNSVNIKKVEDVKSYLEKEVRYSVTKRNYDANDTLSATEKAEIAKRVKSFTQTVDSGKLTNQQVVEKLCDINNLKKNKAAYLSEKNSQLSKINKCVATCKTKMVNEEKTRRVTPTPKLTRSYGDIKAEQLERAEEKIESQKKSKQTVIDRFKSVFTKNKQSRIE